MVEFVVMFCVGLAGLLIGDGVGSWNERRQWKKRAGHKKIGAPSMIDGELFFVIRSKVFYDHCTLND